MRQKFISLGTNYQIKDDTGRNVFLVKHKNFSLNKKLSFQDMQGNELALIQQKTLSFGNTYSIYRSSKLYATLKESLFTLIGRKFTVDIPGLDALKVKGNFTGYEYTFNRASDVVATVSKKWVALADTYGVNILAGEDEILILACIVAIEISYTISL